MTSYKIAHPTFYLITAVLIFAFMGLTSLISPVLAAKGLSPDETKALINDKTVEAVGARGYESVTYFASDGTYKKKNRGEVIKGAWHIDDEGQLCQRPEGESTASCHLIVKKDYIWKLYKVPKKGPSPGNIKGPSRK